MLKGMGINKIVLVFIGIAFLTLAFAKVGGGYPKIIFVDDDFTEDPSNHKWNSIENAINDANDGDTIYVFDGNYPKNIFVNKEVRIVGMGKNVIVNGIGKEYAINILSENVIIENFKIENASKALIKAFNNFTLKNCSLNAGNITGIEIFANNVSIINCTIEGAFIPINASGRNILLKNLKTFANNSAKGWGIMLNNSKDCILEEIAIDGIENKSIKIEKSTNISLSKISINNSFCGILLIETNSSKLSFINLSENMIGIKMEKSFNNTVNDCNFLGNIGYGIYLENSYNNSIYHNNFINNGINAFDDGANIWNKSIGNYWSDYTGGDENNDGIGDEPYINFNCKDFLPLIKKIEYPPYFIWVDDDYSEQTVGWKIDHFKNIQEAIDAIAEGGKCRVYNGTYGKVFINKSLEIFSDENAKITSASDAIVISAENLKISGFEIVGGENCIRIQNSRNVSISNCSIKNGVIGIYLINSLNCSVSNSSISSNTKGIYFFNSSFSNVYKNFIADNSYFGVEISQNSSMNKIYDCSIENNRYYGVYIVSSNNSIWHNNFINNTAFDIGANDWQSSYEKAIGNYWSNYTGKDENRDGIGDQPYELQGGAKDLYPLINKISYHPSFAWISPSFNASIPGWLIDHFSSLTDAISSLQNGGACFVFPGVYEENVRVDKEAMISGWNAIFDGRGGNAFNISARNVRIYNLVVRECWSDAGIKIFGENVTIWGCEIYNNYDGIKIYGKNATIENCSIHDNSFNGIYLANASTIRNCSIYSNNNGIFVEANSSKIENNNFKECVVCVKIVNSSLNEMYKNTFRESIYGANLSKSSENIFYFNNFINNVIDAVDDGANIWNKSIGNRSVGNYWSNYTGKDEDIDGIGDEPYIIDQNITDYFPLIKEAGQPICKFNFSPETPYSFEKVSFIDASFDFDGDIVSWIWNFGDGNYSNEKNPYHEYGKRGIYKVNLTVTDDEGKSDSMEKDINVSNRPPFANFTWNPLNPTDLENITFDASSSYDLDGSIVNYKWDFGDGSTGYGKVIEHRYIDDGSYNVTLTIIDDDGEENSTTNIINVSNRPPFANFNWSPLSPFSLENITFDASSSYDLDGSIVNYTWQFGDGSTGYGKVIEHRYIDDGSYNVTLTIIDDDGEENSTTNIINVSNRPPFANFTWSPLSPFSLENITFDASSSNDLDGFIVNYTWQFGDGNISYGINVTHRYADNGTYNVTLIIRDDDGDENSITKIINVSNVPPIANFFFLDNVTILATVYFYSDMPNYASFDPDGQIVNYTWEFGDGNKSYDKNPTHKYKNKGVYRVTLTVTDNDGAKSSISKSITVINLPPFANFTWNPLNPTDLDQIFFNANNSYDSDGSIANYTWNFGDGSVGYGINVTHKYADNGSYTVTLIITDNDGATATKEKVIEVANIAPFAIFSAPQEAREKEEVTFDASPSYDRDGSIVNYTWDFGDESAGYGKVVKHKYEKRGTYTVKLTVFDDDGANSTFYGVINIREKEKIPGFELAIIIAASAILIFMRKYRLGIWRM
ncbi:MAG: PKD domain-containing protein [Thermoplasmatales archaeon]|nr:PKD domain-containing protein [Thermoplasmatales archaeon]